MKVSSVQISAALLILLAVAGVSAAQNRERYGISAQAGGVNAVSGQVTVKHSDQQPQLLSSNDNLESGDIVRTAYSGQVEILLNPGTYLRLAENSEFVMADTSLNDLLVTLNRGSAIIEATGPDQISQYIPVETPQKRFTIVRSGIYRITVGDGLTRVLVRKGCISLADDSLNLVKSGKGVTFNGKTATTAKLTKQDDDDFDNWSAQRGKTLARANRGLSTRELNGLLAANEPNWFGSSFGRWGIWTWSSGAGCYTFLPFYYGWGTPYGSYYGLYAGFAGLYPDGSCCRPHIYTRPIIVSNPTYGNPSPGGSGSPTGSGGSGGLPTGSGGSSAGPSSGGVTAAPRTGDPGGSMQTSPRIKQP